MATTRPNAEPAATTVAVGDIFLIDGATGVRALAASVVPLRDANANVAINNVVLGYATTATAASTTTLTAASTGQQFFTGSTTQTVLLPVTSTLALGQAFAFQNDSTGAVTIQSSGANNVLVMAPGTDAIITCILLTGTTAASWDVIYFGVVPAPGKVLTVSNSLTLAGTDGTTQTFQASDTIVGRATTDTLTNKTFDTAGTGNVLKINGVAISANTGTGSNVLATSPALVTPTLGAATATSLTFSPTTGGIIGTTTNDNAAAGTVGELLTATVLRATNTAISSATPKIIATVSLTAGDWDVTGYAGYSVVTSPGSFMAVGITTGATTTLPGFDSGAQAQLSAALTVGDQMIAAPVFRVSLASTTSVNIVGELTYGGTATCYAGIRARRVR